jgi:hypothetical protein
VGKLSTQVRADGLALSALGVSILVVLVHPLPRQTSLRTLLLSFDWDLLLLLDGLFLDPLGGRELTHSGNKLFQVSIHGIQLEVEG